MKVFDLINKMYKKEPLPDKIELQCVNSITKKNNKYRFNPIAETYVNNDGDMLQNATMFATLLDLEIKEKK